MDGWIILHRKITEWEWYKDTNTFKVFLHLLLNANIKPVKYMGQIIRRGSLVTSVSKIAKETGLSTRSVRTSLNHLKSTNELTIKTTNKFSVITIVNYRLYQDYNQENDKQNGKQAVTQATNNRQASDKQPTSLEEQRNKETKITNIKDKKSIGGKEKRFSPPTLEEIKNYCKERENTIDAEQFIDFYTSKNWYIGKTKMKDWKAAVRTWEKREAEKGKPIIKKNAFTNYEQRDYDFSDYEKQERERRKKYLEGD